ncbi:hypothetical protein U0070_003051 [Myodes glareolus]|uniref:Uncharacterized protein n=1 Tax=Myodes glareolus TaxID=447135 RepID=A0AAW0I0Y2_MYOGA
MTLAEATVGLHHWLSKRGTLVGQQQLMSGDGKILYSQHGDVMRALGQNSTKAKVAKIPGSPESGAMNREKSSGDRSLTTVTAKLRSVNLPPNKKIDT